MITVEEIKKKAVRMYPHFLKSVLLGDQFFPKTLRSDKILSNDFIAMSKELSVLMSGSKDRNGFGYIVQSRPVNTRNHGVQDIPESIVFETQEDYLKFISKTNEFDSFIKISKTIKDAIPQLIPWMERNPLVVIDFIGKWDELLQVCNFFLNNFEPHKFYIRELPISVHTKFIEENKGVIRSLLDELIPEKLNANESVFEKRFHLKYVQPEVRIRFLESFLVKNIPYRDLSVTLEEFINNPINCQRIFIVENKMNFLAFPGINNSIAIWGKGFAIESLKQAEWLKNKEIYYWSDLDIQGLQMLSQLKSYFPRTKSFIMDGYLLESFNNFVVSGTPGNIDIPRSLNESETILFGVLKSKNIRLEQERIPQWFVVQEVDKLNNN